MVGLYYDHYCGIWRPVPGNNGGQADSYGVNDVWSWVLRHVYRLCGIAVCYGKYQERRATLGEGMTTGVNNPIGLTSLAWY